MVEEIRGIGRDGMIYTTKCQKCGKEFSGFYGVSGIIFQFAKEHENNCYMKNCCL